MKKRALVVTNNLITREILCYPLQMAGWGVVLAANIPESLEQCGAGPLNLMVVDLDWPFDGGGDARDTVKQVLDICPGLPVIVISARADVRKAVASLGVEAVAETPIDVPALLRTAEEVASQSGNARPNRNGTADVDRLPPNPEAFREAMWRRTNAPFQVARQPRDWGLNE